MVHNWINLGQLRFDSSCNDRRIVKNHWSYGSHFKERVDFSSKFEIWLLSKSKHLFSVLNFGVHQNGFDDWSAKTKSRIIYCERNNQPQMYMTLFTNINLWMFSFRFFQNFGMQVLIMNLCPPSAFNRIARVVVFWREVFLGRGSPSAFDWMTHAEDSPPFQNTRPFGLENTRSHFVSWAVSSDTPA